MMIAEAILAAIQRIHEAPLTADGWTRALPSIAAATQSDVANLLVQNTITGADEFITGFELAPSHLAGFALAARAGKLPDWSRTMPIGAPILSSSAMSDRDFLRSEFYNVAIRPMGTFYGLAVKPLRTPQRRVFLTTGRRLGREDFSGADLAAMQLLVSHVITALHVSRRLNAADMIAAGACAALDRLHMAVILVDATAKVVFANPMADALLVEAQSIAMQDGHVTARDSHANRALLHALASSAGNGRISRRHRPVIDLPQGEGRQDLRAVVVPFRPDESGIETLILGGRRPRAMIMIFDPERERMARKESLRREFGLTAAEADVALEIVEGDGRDATAHRLGITVATVRTHLLHIFEKTGVSRQAELVRLILLDVTDFDSN